MIDALRYGLAWLAVASLPAAVGYWYVLHPFVDFWRRVGKAGTFSALALLFALNVGAAWWWRDALLPPSARPPLPFVIVGAILYLAAAGLQTLIRRQLNLSVLAGSPELDADGAGGKLLDQGLYAHMRHPRYVTVMLGMLGAAFLVDYPAVWWLVALLGPGLYGVVLLEERELRRRFGARYVEYARRVPRFVPRLASWGRRH